jgi:murein L,D-transpeptidase YcbB/YkuD
MLGSAEPAICVSGCVIALNIDLEFEGIVGRYFLIKRSAKAVMVAVLATFAAMAIGAAQPVAAQDYAGIQAGPVGNGVGSNTYDREFIREWEANPPKGFATLSKYNIEPTKAAIKRYADIVAAGGWVAIPEVQMQAMMSDPAVVLLRKRLAASGDLRDADTTSPSFDLELEKAVKRFQASNGLTPTGIVDKRTIAALNVPAEARLKQLKTNLGRLTDLAAATGNRKYVVVNIPSAHIEAVENGQIVARYAGVVGKIDRPTPLLHSAITDLNFNPVWRIPPTVESEDLIPRGREMQKKGQSVLAKFHIDAYDGGGKKVDPDKIDWTKVTPGRYTYSEQPNKENPLGFLKINFDSEHSVYMHDTPSESIFGRNFRSASSGCIRVHNIEHLATWLLGDQGGWDKDRVEKMKESGERLDVRLKKPVPLHFVYVTAWATEDGVVQFRRDLYQKDGIGGVASAY